MNTLSRHYSIAYSFRALLLFLFIYWAGAKDGSSCPPPPPNSPSNLTAVSISSSEIDLSWSDVYNETGYVIERSPNGTNSWMQIGTRNSDVTSYQDTYNLSEGTRYYYRLYAFNTGGNSGYSNVANNWTRLITPTYLQTITRTSRRIDMSWTDNSNSETGYKLYRSADGINYSLVATLPANTEYYADKQLSAATTYYYKVLAFNSILDSSYSNVSSHTTLDSPIFSETWDQVTGPIYPICYQANNFASVTGSDESWIWGTANDAVTSCGFRVQNTSREVGRFAAASSTGDFTLSSVDSSCNLNNESNWFSLNFEANIDSISENCDAGVRLEMRSETNYSGTSAIVMRMSSKTDEPALCIYSRHEGIQSNNVETESNIDYYGGPNKYWVSAIFIKDGTHLDVHYDIYLKDDPTNPMISGEGSLDQVPNDDLGEIYLNFGQNYVGSIDDIELISNAEPQPPVNPTPPGDVTYQPVQVPPDYYHNPLLIKNYRNKLIGLEDTGDYLGDPFILKYMGKYYLYTSNQWVRTWVSDDLVNWTLQWDGRGLSGYGSLVRSADECEWMNVPDSDPRHDQAWTPFVFYDNGTFHMYVSHWMPGEDDKSTTEALVTARRPYGVWHHDHSFAPDNFMILGDILMDDDGQLFATYNGLGMRYQRMLSFKSFDPTIHILENTRFNAKSRNIHDHPVEGYVEGPGMFKINGRYHMLFSGNTYYYPAMETRAISTASIDSFDETSQYTLLANDDTSFIAPDGNNYTGPSAVGNIFLGPDLITRYIMSSTLVNAGSLESGWTASLTKVLMLDRIKTNSAGLLEVVDQYGNTIKFPTLSTQPRPKMPDWATTMSETTIGSDWINVGGGTWNMDTSSTDGFMYYFMKGQSVDSEGLRKEVSTTAAKGNCTYEFNLRLYDVGESDPKRFGCVISYDDISEDGIYILIERVSESTCSIQVKENYRGDTFDSVAKYIPRGNLPPWDPFSWHTLRITKSFHTLSVDLDYLHIGDYPIRNQNGGHPGFVVENCEAWFSYTAFTNHPLQNNATHWQLYQ